MTNKRLFGQLFIPRSNKPAYSGVWLNIAENEIYIEAELGCLCDKNWEILNGVFNGMDKVTLVNCYSDGGSQGRGGTWRKIRVSYLIKSTHYNTVDDLKFNKIVLSNPSLNNWVDSPNNFNLTDNWNLVVPKKEIITEFHVEDFSIKIFFDYARTSDFKSMSFERKCFIEIISIKPKHVSDFSEITTNLKRLILFVTNKNPEYDRHFLFNKKNEDFELVNTKNNLTDKRFSSNIEFMYHDLKDNFQTLCTNWFSNKKLDAIVDLSLEKHLNVNLSHQGYFLNMCVAIESYHANFSLKSKSPEMNIKLKNRKSISELIEDVDLKKWFNEQSTFWKNPTLFERLTSYENSISKIIENNINCSTTEFIKKVKSTRNDIAHKGEYDNHLTHFELFLFGKVLELILRTEILKSLGIDELKNKNFLSSSNRIINILVNINNYV